MYSFSNIMYIYRYMYVCMYLNIHTCNHMCLDLSSHIIKHEHPSKVPPDVYDFHRRNGGQGTWMSLMFSSIELVLPCSPTLGIFRESFEKSQLLGDEVVEVAGAQSGYGR